MIEKLSFAPREDQGNWDADLLGSGYPHPWQSTAYGDYVKNQGHLPCYIDIRFEGKVVGHCLLSLKPGNVGEILYGPIMTETCSLDYSIVLSGLLEYVRQRGAIAIELITTPANYSGRPFSFHHPLRPEIFVSPFINLQANPEEIYHSFHASVRKNIKKCERSGVEVMITNDHIALGPYLEMLTAHRRRLGFPFPPFYPHEDSMKIFNRPYTSLEVATAKVGDRYLAGAGYVVFGKVVIEVAIGQSDAYEKKALPAHDLIKSRAIDYYGKKGIKYYDVTGVKKFPRNQKEENLKRFKSKFSNTFAEYAAFYNIAFQPFQFFAYRVRQKINRFISGPLWK